MLSLADDESLVVLSLSTLFYELKVQCLSWLLLWYSFH